MPTEHHEPEALLHDLAHEVRYARRKHPHTNNIHNCLTVLKHQHAKLDYEFLPTVESIQYDRVYHYAIRTAAAAINLIIDLNIPRPIDPTKRLGPPEPD